MTRLFTQIEHILEINNLTVEVSWAVSMTSVVGHGLQSDALR